MAVAYHSKAERKDGQAYRSGSGPRKTDLVETHSFYFPQHGFTAEVTMDERRRNSKDRPAGLWLLWDGAYPTEGMEAISLGRGAMERLGALYQDYTAALRKFRASSGTTTLYAGDETRYYERKPDTRLAEDALTAALEDAFEEILFGHAGKSI